MTVVGSFQEKRRVKIDTEQAYSANAIPQLIKLSFISNIYAMRPHIWSLTIVRSTWQLTMRLFSKSTSSIFRQWTEFHANPVSVNHSIGSALFFCFGECSHKRIVKHLYLFQLFITPKLTSIYQNRWYQRARCKAVRVLELDSILEVLRNTLYSNGPICVLGPSRVSNNCRVRALNLFRIQWNWSCKMNQSLFIRYSLSIQWKITLFQLSRVLGTSICMRPQWYLIHVTKILSYRTLSCSKWKTLCYRYRMTSQVKRQIQ